MPIIEAAAATALAKAGTEVFIALIPQVVRSMGYKWDDNNLTRVEKNMIENLLEMKFAGQIEELPEMVSKKAEKSEKKEEKNKDD